jgi:hypothetical protein
MSETSSIDSLQSPYLWSRGNKNNGTRFSPVYGESGQGKKGNQNATDINGGGRVVLYVGRALAHAQTTHDSNADNHKSYATPRAYADQSTSQDDSMKVDCSSSKKMRAKHHKQEGRMKQNDDPRPDKDAPQNQVEYGGAG